MWTVSFKLCVPPVEPRMVGMERHQCLQYCQLADKGWPCLINLAHHGNFWVMKIFIVLPSAESLPDLTAERGNLTPVCVWVCVCMHESMCVVVCFICEQALTHVCTVHSQAHFSMELTTNTRLPFSAHTYSVLLTVCCHMLYYCVCVVFVAKLKG